MTDTKCSTSWAGSTMLASAQFRAASALGEPSTATQIVLLDGAWHTGPLGHQAIRSLGHQAIRSSPYDIVNNDLIHMTPYARHS